VWVGAFPKQRLRVYDREGLPRRQEILRESEEGCGWKVIVLDNGYRIEADAYQFTLYKEGKPNKHGVPSKLDCTYHPTLAGALERYYRLIQAQKISSGYLSLDEAIKASTAILSELADITKHLEVSPNGKRTADR
jgi:hypothetical protein